MIKTSEKNYEFVEHISDVNCTYVGMLVEQNCICVMDTFYVYEAGHYNDQCRNAMGMTPCTPTEANTQSTGRTAPMRIR